MRAPIDSSAHEVVGATGHRFIADSLVRALMFSQHLRPSASMAAALADADHYLHGDSSKPLQDSLRDGSTNVPSAGTFRMSRIKGDIFTIMWERVLQLASCFLRCIYVDSSPQCGANYLCMREDRIRIPRGVPSSNFLMNVVIPRPISRLVSARPPLSATAMRVL